MNREDAIEYMIKKVEEIEKDRLAAHFSIDANKQKKEAVDRILKALKEVQLDDEDQQD